MILEILKWTAIGYAGIGLAFFLVSLKWSSVMDSIKTGLMWPLAAVFMIGMAGAKVFWR